MWHEEGATAIVVAWLLARAIKGQRIWGAHAEPAMLTGALG